MRAQSRTRAVVIAVALAVALTLSLSDTSGQLAEADGPTTSFSVDLDPAAPGIQATRTVALNQPFSISVWLDATEVASYIQATVKLNYNDVRLTGPASGIPSDWKDAAVLNTTGGSSAPWPDPWQCAPDPGASAQFDEDNVGIATFYVSCFAERGGPFFYVGPLFQFVLRCDSSGSAAVTLENWNGATLILEPNFDHHDGHVHNATVTCGAGGSTCNPTNVGAGMPDAAGDCDPGGGSFANVVGDGCVDDEEAGIGLSNGSPWDFLSVPLPALFAASVPESVFRDNEVTAQDAQAIFAYATANAESGQAIYENDLNQNGVKDGWEYDRQASAGPPDQPDGSVTAQDAQLAFAQASAALGCTSGYDMSN